LDVDINSELISCLVDGKASGKMAMDDKLDR